MGEVVLEIYQSMIWYVYIYLIYEKIKVYIEMMGIKPTSTKTVKRPWQLE